MGEPKTPVPATHFYFGGAPDSDAVWVIARDGGGACRTSGMSFAVHGKKWQSIWDWPGGRTMVLEWACSLEDRKKITPASSKFWRRGMAALIANEGEHKLWPSPQVIQRFAEVMNLLH